MSKVLSDLFSLNGRIAFITGGAGLLGLRHAKALADAGASVILADILDKELVCEKIRQSFAPEITTLLEPLKVDITDPKSLQSARDMILDKYGKIDILVNNASWNDTVENRADSLKSMQFEYYPLELWNRSLAVNLTGTFLTSQIIGGAMVDRRSGSIINIASTYGMVAPDQKIYISPEGKRLIYKSPSYSATKGAVLSLTRFLASYWGQQGIRVNALSPGGVENGQEDFFVRNYSARTMLGRMAGPCDYEGAVVFLASDASAYMTGANLVVDGGWTAW